MEGGDGEGVYSSGGSIFLRISCKLSSQAKIDGAHGVESWVWDLSLGYGAPTAAKICPRELTYCSTLLLLIVFWLAARTPVRIL